jgi:hypothetical protein
MMAMSLCNANTTAEGIHDAAVKAGTHVRLQLQRKPGGHIGSSATPQTTHRR